MTIERNKDEIIIKIPASLGVEKLQRVLDYLTYTEATSQSKATEKDVDNLVSEIKLKRKEKTNLIAK